MSRTFPAARRLRALPPYLFIRLDEMHARAVKAGRDVISFGIGDPDMPTPREIVSVMRGAVADPSTHRYPLGKGKPKFREAVARWYRSRFGVRLNPDNEVCALIGSKEGIGHFPWAFVNPGERVLVPSPGYPVYGASTILCGGKVQAMPLTRENAFLPDLESLSARLRKGFRARLMFINYPNNPTGATAPAEFYRRVIALAHRHGFIVAHDAAYSEVWYERGDRPRSFLAFPGAREVGIEFHSLSKTCNMTGWRIGFACGNASLVRGLADLKGNLDSGAFEAVQLAGIRALARADSVSARMNTVYRERRDLLVDGLRSVGLPAPLPRASFYVWTPLPPGVKSQSFATELLDRADILATPGIGFGKWGEGYIRFSLTVPTARIREARLRLERLAPR